MPTNKISLIPKEEADKRASLKEEIARKQSELWALEQELRDRQYPELRRPGGNHEAIASHGLTVCDITSLQLHLPTCYAVSSSPQANHAMLQTVVSSASGPPPDVPLALNLTRADFMELLLPQLRAYTACFNNQVESLFARHQTYLEIEGLVMKIRDVLKARMSAQPLARDEKLFDSRGFPRARKGPVNPPPLLLDVDRFTDEELEPLARLKAQIKTDRETIRELQKRSRGAEEVLEGVLDGLQSLILAAGRTRVVVHEDGGNDADGEYESESDSSSDTDSE